MKKSKLSTRIFLLLLTVLLTVSAVACNSGDTTDPSGNDTTGSQQETTSSPLETEETTADDGETTADNSETTAEDGPDIPAGLTFGEAEFKIYLRGVNSEGVDYAADLYVGDTLGATPTAVDRAVYSRMSQIAETFDIIFDVDLAPDDTLDTTFVSNSAMTQTDVLDLIVDHGVAMLSFAEKNLLLDYAKLPYVDTDQPWWNQDVNETFRTPGGKLFVMTGDISYMSVGTAFSMFFNKDLVAAVDGLDSPYQQVYNDTWTFEVFEQYVATLDGNLNGDNSGVVGQDTFGYATNKWRGPVQMFYSTGGRVLERKGDNWKFTLNNETANEAVFDFRDLIFNSGTAYLELESYANLQLAFMANQIAFFDDHLNASNVFKGSELDYGLVPWPKYNDDVDEYYSAVDAGTSLFATLRNTTEENAKKVSAVLESFAYLGSKDVIPFYFDTILSYQYLKDDDSINMLHIIHDNLVIDFGYFYSDMKFQFLTVAITPDGDSLNQAVSGVLGTALSNMEKWDALDEEE